ncbi:MAG TPA: hypothetical protein DEB09_04195 [Candidatus Magasanikbacteria bacterium]|nr:hypothetical protein [Candidatus Magasanikbacteria bacterium]
MSEKSRERESSKPTPEQQKIIEKVGWWYEFVLHILNKNEFKPSMADAVFIREKLLECYKEGLTAPNRSESDEYSPWAEAMARWLWQMYGINFQEFRDDKMKDMFEIVKTIRESQEKL